MINKQIGTKLSALALALLLAGCGGGGSDGYYNNNNGGEQSGSITDNSDNDGEKDDLSEIVTNQNSFTQLIMSNNALLIGGDTSAIQVQLLKSSTGGALSNQKISLQIEEAQSNGLSFSPSEQVTDENGFATFNLNFITQNLSEEAKAKLLASGININVLNQQGNIISNHSVRVVKSETEKPTYDLVLTANKYELALTGDNALINVRALDKNGGPVKGAEITLSLQDYMYLKLESTSRQITDEFGNAQFKVTLPPLSGDNLPTGVTVIASLTSSDGIADPKELPLKFVAGATANPIGQITLGNAGTLAKDKDEIYYTEKFSAQIVDENGKPIKAAQKVNVTIDVVSALTGYYLTGGQLKTLRDQDILNFDSTYVFPVQEQIKSLEIDKLRLNNSILDLDKNSTTYEEDKRQLERQIRSVEYDIFLKENELSTLNAKKDLASRYTLPARTQVVCNVASNSQLATSLVDQASVSPINQYEYTTDASGKFDFNVNFARRYAQWQTVVITASTIRGNDQKVESKLHYPLGLLESDFSSTTRQPFDSSPFNNGTNGSCSYNHPWLYLLN